MYILLVDEDGNSRESIAKFLRRLGHEVTEAANGGEALGVYLAGDYPMVISDIKMPGMSGIELLQAISATPGGPETDVVLFTGHGDMDTAIQALRAGAYDYLLKPINVEELAVLTNRIAEHQSLRRENVRLTHRFDEEVRVATEETREELARARKLAAQVLGLGTVGFYSDIMQRLVAQARKFHADRSVPVLIEGETGTGKEVIARMIHFGDMDDTAPFVDINCAALPPTLFESELFGYEAGAFTGGLTKGQKGKIDLATGGTLFLDEVGDLPLEAQSKLLRVIQEKEYYRVGGLKKIKADVRLICATNAGLERSVAAGNFRKDLYYRLKVGHIYIPPLRERKTDIIPLAELFLRAFARQKGKRFTAIGEAARRVLEGHSWPGNVRELRGLIECAVLLYNDSVLRPEHLEIAMEDRAPGMAALAASAINETGLPEEGFSLEEHIRQLVLTALEKHGGNKAATARYLGLSRRQFYGRFRTLFEDDEIDDE